MFTHTGQTITVSVAFRVIKLFCRCLPTFPLFHLSRALAASFSLSCNSGEIVNFPLTAKYSAIKQRYFPCRKPNFMGKDFPAVASQIRLNALYTLAHISRLNFLSCSRIPFCLSTLAVSFFSPFWFGSPVEKKEKEHLAGKTPLAVT